MDPSETPTPSRRDILTKATAAAACAGCVFAAVPVVSYVIPRPPRRPEGPVAIAKVAEIPDGIGIIRSVGSLKFLILRHDGKLIAMDAKCNHLGCIIEWDAKMGKVKCNCHGGRFTPEGKRLAGPPENDQPPVKVRIKGDQIFLDL